MRRLLLVLSFVAALAVHAAARAGGGHSYSGGSHSSSHSYSSHSSYSGSSSSSYGYRHSSDFGLIDAYIAFVFLHPVLGVPFTLLLLYLFAVVNGAVPTTGSLESSGPEETVVAGMIASRMAAELERLTARDPGFGKAAFLLRAGNAFRKIQEAWSAGDMAAARAFISDGVNERFTRQLGAMKERGVRNLMENVEISDCELLACRSDRHFDALWVKISAVATDRTVDEAGRDTEQTLGRQPFTEIWTFLRRPGARTLKKPGVIEGSCPNCGSPLPIVDAAHCTSCKSWVNSGDYDWVLTEITQACEWSLRDPARDVDGWVVAASDDPGLSLPALEDRASVIFWRWAEARRRGNNDALKPVASAEFLKRTAAYTAPFDDAAVGAVEVVAFEDEGPWRRAHISIKWSGAGESRQDFFVLNRLREAKTDERQGLRTARCASCGAPPSAGSESACTYCNAPLNDGKKDWVLTEIVPFGEWRRPSGGGAISAVRAAVPEAELDWGSEMSPVDAYSVLALTMLADGEETLAEKAFLQAYAKSRGIPPLRAAALSEAARTGKLDAPRPENGAQAEGMLRGMIRMSLADGVVTGEESAALVAFAARFGLTPGDVQTMIAEEREILSRAIRG